MDHFVSGYWFLVVGKGGHSFSVTMAPLKTKSQKPATIVVISTDAARRDVTSPQNGEVAQSGEIFHGGDSLLLLATSQTMLEYAQT